MTDQTLEAAVLACDAIDDQERQRARLAALDVFRDLKLMQHVRMVPAGVKGVMDHLPRWGYEISGCNGTEKTRFSRVVPSGFSIGTLTDHEGFRSSLEDDVLTLELAGRPKAKDLAAILGVELVNWDYSLKPDIEILDFDEEPDSSDFDSAEKSTYDTDQDLFTPRQQLVLQTLADKLSFASAARELGKHKATVQDVLQKPRLAYGVTGSDDLAAIAFANGEITLDKIPEGKTGKLTQDQLDFLKSAFDLNLERRAKCMEDPRYKDKQKWKSIYLALGLKINRTNRFNAYLIALKDGAVTLEDVDVFRQARPDRV